MRREKGRWLERGIPWLLLLAAIGGTATLFSFAPDRYPFYPQCQFHRLTGLNCPGCGSLRALHELTHGHVGAALRLNPLLVLGFPAAFAIGAWSFCRRPAGKADRIPSVRPIWIWIALGVTVAFGVLRNLPFAPFDRLGP